jgi:hypothetical protein
MNTKNQKEVPAGLKNRIDQLEAWEDREAKAEQARREILAAMTGPELMEHLARLAEALTPAPFKTTANPNN